MSTAYSIARRTFSLNSLFAGAACAIALALTAGPALAQSSDMGRVEISGRVVEAPIRYDVLANCNDIEGQLQGALDNTWVHQRRYGEVKVQFAIENGVVGGVQASGISSAVARDVRHAVNRLHCGPQATASAQIYSFSVDFVDPNARPGDTQMANTQRGVRVALLSK